MPSSTSLRLKKFAEVGELTVDNFDVVAEKLPALKDGEVTAHLVPFFLKPQYCLRHFVRLVDSSPKYLSIMRPNAQSVCFRERNILPR
jgi:hypothetical protein